MRGKLALVAVLTVGLAACGGSSDEQAGNDEDAVVIDDQTALFQAAATTLEADSARMELSLEFEGGAGGEAAQMLSAFSVEAEGVSDLQSGNGTFTMDMSSIAEMAGGELGLSGDDFVIEVRTIDGITYMHAPFFTEVLGVDTPWVSVDTADMLDVDDETLSQISGQTDPTGYVEMLSGASDDVEEVGHEEVRGEDTTHYTATVNLGELAEQELEKLPPELRDRIGTDGLSATQFGSLGTMLGDIDVPTEVWVDGEGRLRKMTMFLDMSDLLATSGLSADEMAEVGDIGMVLTMEMFDYGTDVNVEAPPASEVTDVTDQLDEPVS
jgi:hypothetical protein